MTKPSSSLYAVMLGVALSAIAMPAAAKENWNQKFDSIEDALKDQDLPAPPKLAAPNAEPNRSRPPMVTMTWGSKMPLFPASPSAQPGKLKSLKTK